MNHNLLKEQLKRLPTGPGVYMMKDAGGNILYVGKAANLRSRVRSYFGSRQGLSLKIKRLVSRVGDLDFFITASEEEALILELNLIKRHRPHYNARLKDDKNFPYLKIDLGEDWPRVQITRRLAADGSRYFGPFASAGSVRRAFKVIKEIFPFRSCARNMSLPLSRPCLEYDIHRCCGPCIDVVSKEEYAEIIRQLILFLEGKQELVVHELENKMRRAALALEYEKAAGLRDQIQSVKKVVFYQKMATAVSGEQDVIAFVNDNNHACVQVFFIRSGKLIGRESFTLQGTRSEEPEQVMTSFVKQFYDSSPYVPPLILLQHPLEDRAVIASWLKSKRGSQVRIQVPRRGDKKKLVDLVAKNAQAGLEQLKIKQLSVSSEHLKAALKEIKRELSLPRLPHRMEGYDISNIQGRLAVGSMVVFEGGQPKPADYRRFSIKLVPGSDDYAMLREVIRRRFSRLKSSDAKNSWAILPDLVLVDGGKGQLSSTLEAMHDTGASAVPVASLAKEKEEIFIPQRAKPIRLPYSSPGLQLLQRLRDEAHRFAIGYHRRIRKKQAFASALDSVPGIGPKRKRHLLRQFGSVRAIGEASLKELSATKSMNQSLAQKIKEYL